MPKISIVVPVYKVEKYIEKCLLGLTNQTFRDLEIILVDDGSPDNCGAICDKFAETDKRIKVIHKANGGVSAARNDGLEAATGQYVIFMDSDDYVPGTACADLFAEAERTDADVVVGDVYQVLGEQEKYTKFYDYPFVSDDPAFKTELIRADFFRNYCPCPPKEGAAFGYGGPWNKLVKRSLLMDHNIRFDLRVKGLYDDILYTAHVLANASKVAYIQKPVYCYRLVTGSLTQSYRPNMPEIASAIIGAFQEFIRLHGIDGRFDTAFHALVIRMLHYSIPRYYCNKSNPKNIFELSKELKRIMKSPEYAQAARYAEIGKLFPGQRLVARLLKHQSAFLAIILFRLKPLK